MSNLKALITMLVLGTSSVAMADSSLSFHATAQASWGTPVVTSPVVRDHRTSYATYQAPTRLRGTWISLSEPMNLFRGRGALDINSSMPLNQIRLQSASGQAFISTITVQYVNGASQVVTLNQWIDARNPMAQFNLNRTAAVDSILINGSRGMRSGKFQVFGYASSTRPEVPVYSPPIYQPPVYQAPTQHSVMLAPSLNFLGTTGAKMIGVEGANRFSTLRIQGASGQTYIKRIEVRFSNGQGQTLNAVDRVLLPGQVLDIPLDGNGANTMTSFTVFTNDLYQPVTQATGEINVSAF